MFGVAGLVRAWLVHDLQNILCALESRVLKLVTGKMCLVESFLKSTFFFLIKITTLATNQDSFRCMLIELEILMV